MRSVPSAARAAPPSRPGRCERCPIGVPKLMVSTVASGDTSPYVGTTDVTMMHSVVDVAGINRISARIFENAARALAGLAAGDGVRTRRARSH